MPGWHAGGDDIGSVLNSDGARLTLGRRRQRLQAFLVCGEVTLSVILIIASGLMMKTLWTLERVKLGFNPQDVLTARINVNNANCKNPEKCFVFYDELLTRVRPQAGITKAALTNGLPLSGNVYPFPLEAEGSPVSAGTQPATATQYIVSPDYFSAMQIPALRGRLFDVQDQPQSAGVVMVSSSMANHFWPGQDPIGKHIRPIWQTQWRTIVGVVDDVRSYAVGDAPSWAPEWTVYIPYAQSGTYGTNNIPWTMTLVVRTSGVPADSAGILRSTLAGIDPTVPMSEVRTMDAVLSAAVSTPKVVMALLTGFAAIALTLGLIGIYGVLSFTVRSRTAELGVRMALGAKPRDLALMVVKQAMYIALAGTAVGLAAAAFLTQALRGMLFRVAPLDPVIFIAAPLLLLATALVASYIPARRASTLDPIKALRSR
jgi:putative ABC transport system permease protein